MKFTSSQPSRAHYNPTITYFTSASKNLTQFVKVFLIKLSDMFIRQISSDFSTVKVLRYTVYKSKDVCYYCSTIVQSYTTETITCSMKVVIVAVIAIFGWDCYLVVAQEMVCSTSCSTVGMLQSTPGRSCSDIYQINKVGRRTSGNYWINTTTGVHQVYCDMELECGGHKGGWMRIADLDTSRGDDCPSGWAKITTPNQPPYPAIPVCRSPSDTQAGCFPTFFSVSIMPVTMQYVVRLKAIKKEHLQLLMKQLHIH